MSEHKCEQMPEGYTVEWDDMHGGNWYLEDAWEVFVAITFCPFCGVRLERPTA